jgi:RNA polymerase sigma factor (sigma-70 family)
MSEQTALGVAPRPIPPLHALQTDGRTREPRVVAQINLMLQSPRAEFWRRARQREHTSPDWLQEETLVAILRIRERQGEPDEADRIAELLIERTTRKIARQIGCWKLASQYVEECTRDVQAGLIEAIYSDERNHEFWEVRFWVCLERRINNTVRKYRNLMDRETVYKILESEDGSQTETVDFVPDVEPITPQLQAEMGEALALLTEHERLAFVLYNGEQWSQQEIAEHLQVTDRTVRNLLSRAHRRLEPWRNESIN